MTADDIKKAARICRDYARKCSKEMNSGRGSHAGRIHLYVRAETAEELARLIERSTR